MQIEPLVAGLSKGGSKMKYFFYGWVILISCACYTTQTMSHNSNITDIDLQQNTSISNDDKSSTNSSLEGLYFGVSNNELGQRAWLIRITKNKGILYMPPNNLEIPKLEITSAGSINFQSDVGLGGKSYSFNGQIISKSIQGEFDLLSGSHSDGKTTKFKTALQKIDLSSLNDMYGLYSNVQYVEEGGDLVGEDLILIPSNKKMSGVFTSYENEMIPYAIDVKQQGNKMKFNINTRNGEQNFQGLISSEKFNFWRNNVNDDPETKPVTLIKKQQLSDFLVKVKE